ncbi:MAG: tetratricopeptide repeat protein [Treponemataceae bacterium]
MFLTVIVSIAGICIPIFTFLIVRSLILPVKYEKLESLLEEKQIFYAIKQTKKILFANTNDHKARLILAKLYSAENKNELALIELKFIMQIRENKTSSFAKKFQIEYHRVLASVYLKLEKINEALDAFLILIKLDKKRAEYFFQAGKLLEKKALYEQAALYYQKAGMIDKHHVDCHASLGTLLLRFKKFDEAKQEFDHALSLNPENLNIYYYLGQLFREEKKYPQALEAFDIAIHSVEVKQKAHIEKGFCFLETDKVENAMVEFEYAVESSKKHNAKETLFAQYLLGFCYEKLDKIDHALSQWNSIYMKDKHFQNVAEKINQYKAQRQQKREKDFINLSSEYFVQYCEDLLQSALLFVSKKFELTSFGCKILAIPANSQANDHSTQRFCFLFSRQNHPIDASVLQYQLNLMHAEGTSRIIVYSLSGYSADAISFKQGKPIDLKNEEDFKNLLEKAAIAV